MVRVTAGGLAVLAMQSNATGYLDGDPRLDVTGVMHGNHGWYSVNVIDDSIQVS